MKMSKRILTMLIAVVWMVSLLPLCSAAEEDFPMVLAQAKKGVVQIYGVGNDGKYITSWVGTGFAVGPEGEESDVFLTNWHVVTGDGEFSEEEARIWILQENCPINSRTCEPDPDRSITCKVLKTTSGYPDYAIIQATEPISGYETLPLLPSEAVMDGSKVYALGYPAVVGDASVSHYGIDDITSTDGIISQHMQFALGGDTWILMHTAKISGGNSGGPLITQKGAVVGLNTYGFGEYEENMDRYCAVYIDYAIEGLEELGLPYALYEEKTDVEETVTQAGEEGRETRTEDGPEEEDPDEEESDEELIERKPKKKEPDLILILGGAAAAAAAVTVISLILLGKKKKKKKREQARRLEEQRQREAAQRRLQEEQRRLQEEQRRLQEEQARRLEEQRQREQAVKARVCLNGGTVYPIGAAGGIIGRERDCMIVLPENAPGVSRHHCILEFRDDQLVLRDLNSTYGTFIQGKRLPTGTAIVLKSGAQFSLGSDKIQFTVC